MSLAALPANGVIVPQSTGRLTRAQYDQMSAGKHFYYFRPSPPITRGYHRFHTTNPYPPGYYEIGSSAKFYAMGGNARFPNFAAWDNFYIQWDAQSNGGKLFHVMDNYVVPAVEIVVTGVVLAGFSPAITGAPVGGGAAPVGGGAAPGLSNAQIIAAGNAEGDAGGGLASGMATSGASFGGTLMTQGEAIATKALISTGLGMVMGGKQPSQQPSQQPTVKKQVANPAQNSNMILLLGFIAAGLVLIF